MKVLNTLLLLSVVLLVGCTGADGSLGLPRGDRAGRAPRNAGGSAPLVLRDYRRAVTFGVIGLASSSHALIIATRNIKAASFMRR